MDCFCGCGTTLRRPQRQLNLEAGKVALELLAWDKARVLSDFDSSEAEQVEDLIDEGTALYRRILDQLHGAEGSARAADIAAWLDHAKALRKDRPTMTRKSWIKPAGNEPLLDSRDIDRLDRKHPELSYSGRTRTARADHGP